MKGFKPNKKFMQMAIDEAYKNKRAILGGPFGAVIVKGNRVLAVARNTVLKNDASCHAEVNAVRKASKILGSFDLGGATIYSTTEPCPMCFSTIHWARIKTVIFGANIKDAAHVGFNEMPISNRQLIRLGKLSTHLIEGFMNEECVALLEDWRKRNPGVLY